MFCNGHILSSLTSTNNFYPSISFVCNFAIFLIFQSLPIDNEEPDLKLIVATYIVSIFRFNEVTKLSGAWKGFDSEFSFVLSSVNSGLIGSVVEDSIGLLTFSSS